MSAPSSTSSRGLERTQSSSSSRGNTGGGQGAAGPAPYKSASAEVLKPPPLVQVVALKGQILHWQLYCVNRGK